MSNPGYKRYKKEPVSRKELREFCKAIGLPDPKAYGQAHEQLMVEALNLVMAIHTQLPRELRPRSEFARAGASTLDNTALRVVAERIEAIEYRFDSLQFVMGLRDRDPRFGHKPPSPDDSHATGKRGRRKRTASAD